MTNTPEFNQIIVSYEDQIDQLFDFVEGKSKGSKPRHSSSASSINNGEFGIQRGEAPTATKCFSGCGGYGGDGGAIAVNILNSVGIMTAQIINASANAAAVIIPPAAQAVGQVLPPVLGAVQNAFGKNNNPPPPPDRYSQWGQPPPPPPQQPSPPPPQGQWVWHNGQWVWVPAGQQPPPGSQAQPGGNATATATSYPYQYQPGLTRSKMPQRTNKDSKCGKTSDSAARSLNSHPATQKGCQEIDQEAIHTLQEIDESVGRILSKLG